MRIAEEELVVSGLAMSGNIQATTAAMRDQFNVFNANQNIMRRRIDELSDDIRGRLGKVVKQMNNMRNGVLDEPNTVKTAVNAFTTVPATTPSTPGVGNASNIPGRRAAMVSPTAAAARERGRTSSMSEDDSWKGRGVTPVKQNNWKPSPNK